MTYAEARKMAVESLGKVNIEKSETLRETSKWVHKVWNIETIDGFIGQLNVNQSKIKHWRCALNINDNDD